MNKSEIMAHFGIDPEKIGNAYRGYTLDGPHLVVITHDGMAGKEVRGPNFDFLRPKIPNALWAERDKYDPKIYYYRYHRLDETKEAVKRWYQEKNAAK